MNLREYWEKDYFDWVWIIILWWRRGVNCF